MVQEQMTEDIRPRAKRQNNSETIRMDLYYSWGKTFNGRNFIRGPFNTETEAWDLLNSAIDLDNSYSRVVPIKTISLAEATRIIKSMDVEETKSFEQGLRRARHQL